MYHLARILALAILAPAAKALLNITVSNSVNAGTSIGIHIGNDLHLSDESLDAEFDFMRIFLSATTDDGQISGPICLLADNIPISSTDFIVQIPASVGPPGCFYYLKATRYVREWNGDFQQCALEERTDSGWGAECPATVSNHFSLANATSQWIDFELDGRSRRWHMEYIPCDIYHAVRQGIDEFYDDHPAHLDDAAVDETIYDNIRECLAGLNDDVTAAITAAPIAVGGEIVTETTTTTTPSAPHVVPRAAQTPPENTTEVPTANTTLGYASPPHPIAAPTRPASEGIRPVSRWWTVFASFAIGQAVRIIFGYWPAMEFSSAGG